MPLAYLGCKRAVLGQVGVKIGAGKMEPATGPIAANDRERAAAHAVADLVDRAIEIRRGLFRAQEPRQLARHRRRRQSGGELFTAESTLERRFQLRQLVAWQIIDECPELLGALHVTFNSVNTNTPASVSHAQCRDVQCVA
jgi:hypothetical protein